METFTAEENRNGSSDPIADSDDDIRAGLLGIEAQTRSLRIDPDEALIRDLQLACTGGEIPLDEDFCPTIEVLKEKARRINALTHPWGMTGGNLNVEYRAVLLANNKLDFVTQDQVKALARLQDDLKNDDPNKNNSIGVLCRFALLNAVRKDPLIKDVDIFTCIPSSTVNKTHERQLEFFRALAADAEKPFHILLHRIRGVGKSAYLKSEEKINSLAVDDSHSQEIAGKVICLLDDYLTSGSTAEVCRSHLVERGASKVIVVSIGKYARHVYQEHLHTKVNGEWRQAHPIMDIHLQHTMNGLLGNILCARDL